MTEIVVSLVVGASLAWVSSWIGFLRGKKERALDRRIDWHQEAIEALAGYEEELERLRTEAVSGILASAEPEGARKSGGKEPIPCS